jgi:TM2 domain-containing membrane protein YozV
MFCFNCGREIPDNSKICGYCGAQIQQSMSNQPSGNSQELENQLYNGNPQGYGNQFYNGNPQGYENQYNNGTTQGYGNQYNNGTAQGYGNQPYNGNFQGANVALKSKTTAGLLGIFLGGFGVHNFYLGYTQRAAIQLGCTILGWVLVMVGIGIVIVLGMEIWAFVESIKILTGRIDVDGKGNPLRL